MNEDIYIYVCDEGGEGKGGSGGSDFEDGAAGSVGIINIAARLDGFEEERRWAGAMSCNE